ncbi:uncharacterized protein LOC129262124 [Lytechinus pictus]|uniref:uncharacterized protein LOC129262124 n=1 Tax=Lytechinus pictus TaxID=7653 RepID=UPI0030B9EAFA
MKSKTPSPGGASPGKRIRLDQPSESDELYQVLNIKEEEHEDWAEDAGTNEQPTDLESPTSDQYLDDDINQDDYLQMVAESVYVGSHMGSMPNNKRKQALQRSRYSTLTKQMDLQVSDVDSNQELLQVQQKRMKQATIHNLSFDVEHILRTNALGGAALVDKMKRQRTIDRSGNRLFVQTLVSNLIANYGYNPSPDIKAALAQSIIDQFEFLGDKNGVTGYEQWFVRGKRNLPATGSLEARLRYIRRVHFPRETKRKPADHQREYSVSSKAKKTRVDPTILPEVHEDEVKEATMWMKQNREPKAKVEEYMRTTCKHRYDWIRAENPPTIAEVLDRYPRLLDPGIIDADYRQAISEKTADNLYANWPRIAPRILQYADLQEVKWRKELGMENSNSSELCEEEQQMLAFSILPFLFMGRCKDKSGRCSAVNSLKAFIDHISESTDMPQYLTETGVTERPPVCILTHGGTRWKPQQTFVILEHRPVPCSSLIQAVDVCFKAIYILDIEYHPHTCSVMEFLQHIIYGIPPGSLVRRALISFRTWFNN